MIQLLCTLLLAAPPQNYAPGSDAWNGLEYLKTTAAEAKVSIEMPDELDWTKVQLRQTLLFVAPGSRIQGKQIVNFVTDGGHVIVALEAGGGAELLRAFGVKLSPKPVIHDNYYRDHPAFPRLLPSNEHFLWFNVEDIVLNHPTSFQIDPIISDNIEAPIRFAEPSQAFAVELFRGSGNILFVSDASIFINDMQRRSYGNKQLAANLFRYYCSGAECRLTIIPPWAEESGHYLAQGLNTLEGVQNLFGRAVEELNALSEPTNESLSSKVGSQWLTLGLLLSLFVGALGMLWLENKTMQPWLQKQQ
ncbi:MAG TPA: hypothetical protein EYN66_02805, partial [Myxococcales bacterium]|nr:hypothetical protein [Myxococcales bacterium]